MIELDINSETVCRLIALAREFHVQEEVVISGEPGNHGDDWARQILAAHSDDASYQEFKSIVQDLDPDQQHQLVALMWLGRGDYQIDEWSDAVEYAAENASPATPQYLIAHPLIVEYLTVGLNMFDLNCDEES